MCIHMKSVKTNRLEFHSNQLKRKYFECHSNSTRINGVYVKANGVCIGRYANMRIYVWERKKAFRVRFFLTIFPIYFDYI